MTSLSRGVLAASFLAIIPVAARAGNGGFFSTYDSEVEEGELELMLMNDFTRPSALREGFNPYASHMLELEYGVTSKFAAELMVESYEDLRTRATEFTGYRVEARYRLFEDQVPLNPMVYAEYEDLGPNSRFKMEVSGFVRTPYAQRDEAGGRERVLETRLVLSQRIGAFDLAANWINESNLGGGPTAFGYTLGVMWMPGHAGHSMQRNSAGAHAHETSAAENGATAGYSCPMHPGVTSETPGSCPKCGMKLQRRDSPSSHRRTNSRRSDTGSHFLQGTRSSGHVPSVCHPSARSSLSPIYPVQTRAHPSRPCSRFTRVNGSPPLSPPLTPLISPPLLISSSFLPWPRPLFSSNSFVPVFPTPPPGRWGGGVGKTGTGFTPPNLVVSGRGQGRNPRTCAAFSHSRSTDFLHLSCSLHAT